MRYIIDFEAQILIEIQYIHEDCLPCECIEKVHISSNIYKRSKDEDKDHMQNILFRSVEIPGIR